MDNKPTYEYDVFISYSRKDILGQWINDTFFNLFKTYLDNSLSWTPKIFIDTSDIDPGDSWPERLKRAICYSKCMVSIWSPNYFKSGYCRKECGSMLYREKMLGYRTTNKPNGLVLPVNIFDGKFFPEIAQQINWFLCHDYYLDGEGFKKTERYVQFQDKMKQWIQGVAQAISHSPEWDKNWLGDVWWKNSFEYSEKNLQIVSTSINKKPEWR